MRSKCGTTTSTLGKKVQAVEQWPKVLIAHWKRFAWEREGAVNASSIAFGELFFGGSRQPWQHGVWPLCGNLQAKDGMVELF